MLTQEQQDAVTIAAADAVDQFMSDLNEHISARIRYDRDGGRYRGDNEPGHEELETSFKIAIRAVVGAAMMRA